MRHLMCLGSLAVIALSSRSAGAQSAGGSALSASYDKGVVLATADDTFLLRIALRNQFRFEMNRPLDEGSEATSRLYIPRARLQLEGHVFADNRYKVEASLGDRGSFGFVRDLYIERELLDTGAWLRVGQWKRPFNRQELVSDFGSAFNERAITAELVGGGRDLGVAAHNDYEKSPEGLEWVVGVFNSFSGGADRPTIETSCTEEMAELDCTTAAPTTIPADFGPAVVARAGWNHGGIKGYSEGDLEGGPLRVAVGVNYKVDLADLSRGEEATVADNLSHGAGVDAMLKVEGFDLEVGGFVMKLKSAPAQLAAMAQGGYFVIPGKAQIAARFAVVPAGATHLLETRVAVNWYWRGHSWKLASDGGVLIETGHDPATNQRDRPDLQVRVMSQLTF